MTQSNTSVFLKNLYSKRGRRFTFRNGMSSSDVAFEIWEQLGNRSFELSTFSRIISGDRLFTEEQLLIFCKILRLSHFETTGLLKCSMKDFLNRNFGEDSMQKVFGNNFGKYSSIIRHCRQNGELREAAKIVNTFENLSKKYDEDEYGFIINEKIRICLEYSTQNEIRNLVWNDNLILRDLSQKKKQDDLLLESVINEGVILYIEEAWNESYKVLERVIDTENNKALRALIILIIDAAMLGNYKNFCLIKSKIENLINRNEDIEENDFYSSHEAIARGLVIFGRYREANEKINYLKNCSLSPFCRSQLKRLGVFEYCQMVKRGLDSDIDVQELVKVDKSTKQFRRHNDQVKRMVLSIESLPHPQLN